MDRLRSMPTYGDSLASLPPEAEPDAAGVHATASSPPSRPPYGGPIEYLRSHGVTDDELAALRDALTEEVPDA